MTSNVFERLLAARQLLEVPMNKEGILLPEMGTIATGTQNLNGCTGIVILGKAIILAHVAPLPKIDVPIEDQVVGPHDGDVHFTNALDRVGNLFRAYRQHVQAKTTAWGVFGRLEGAIMETSKLELAARCMEHLGLPLGPSAYDVAPAKRRIDSAVGIAVGMLNANEPALFVKDVVQARFTWDVVAPTHGSPVGSSTATGPSVTGSSE